VSLGRYSVLVLGIGVSLLGLAWLAALRRLDASAQRAAAYGWAIAVLNTLAAHALVVWSEKRSTNVFLGAVLGGMVARMALMLLAVVAGVLLLGLPRLPLAVTLLACFVVFLVLELSVLHRRFGAAPQAGR
jgi:putative flippase GtrA